jgi:hypothetical protein
MSEKLELKEKIQAVDFGLSELWDELDDENKKILKGEFFILNRYISNVKGQPTNIQEHFVYSVNECFNKNWFDLQQHPKLLWMLLCMCSYDKEQKFFHQWIGFKKKDGNTDNKKIKFLSEIYPTMKIKEIEMLAALTTDKEIIELAKKYGFDDKDIKQKLKK